MERFALFRNGKLLARGSIVVIFLALIRSIAEVLRLQHYAPIPLTYEQIYPYIIGALLAAVCLFAMTIALFYNRYKVVVILAVLTVAALLLVKGVYL